MISLLLVFVVIIGVVLLFVLAKWRKPSEQTFSYPFEKQPALFTPAERSFVGVLEQVLEDEYRVFGKVRLADVLRVRRGLSSSERQGAFNRISRKHLDFVVCAADTLDLICAVELDDKSHSEKARQARDTFLEEALEAAGVPLVRFPAKQAYKLSDVQGKLRQSLSVTTPSPVARAKTQTENPNSERVCPKCGAELVVKTAKRGKNAGQKFLACSTYPSCKATLSLN